MTDRRWAPLLLGACILVCFGLSFWVPFFSDDTLFVLGHPWVAGPWPGWRALLGGTFTSTREYEPLVFLLHRIIHSVAGDRVWAYRLSSLALHWANALLVLHLGRRLLGDSRAALAAALLFALFPAHAEVLAVSAFKKHLLVAFFALLILALQDAAVCAVLFGLALLCKESALIIPGLVWLVRRAEPRPAARGKTLYAALAVVALAYAGLRLIWLPRRLHSAAAGLLTPAKCLLWYIGKLLLPLGLAPEHSLAPAAVCVGVLALLGLAALAYRRKIDRVAACGLAWTGLALLPFLNLIPFLNFSLVADRYFYLASAGFALFLVQTGRRLLPARHAPAAAALLALGWGTLSLRYMALFTEPTALWQTAVAAAPDNPRAHAELGKAYLRAGQPALAVTELERSRELAPGFGDMLPALGEAYDRVGRVSEALAAARLYAEAAQRTSGQPAAGAR